MTKVYLPRLQGRSGDDLAARLGSALPVGLPLALFLAWAALQGGYAPSRWHAGAIFLLLLAGIVVPLSPLLRHGAPSLPRAALAAFALFTAWSFLSIAWAEVEGDAWEGANRALLYLAVFAVFLLWPAGPRALPWLLGTFAVGVALVGAGTLLAAARAGDAARFFVDGRLTDPVGYYNANAALFLTAFWPALYLASRREVAALARGLLLAVAGVTLELAVLPQSRGAALAFAVSLLLYLALVPGRRRSLAALLLVGLAALASLGPLLDVYSAATADLHGSLVTAATAVGVSAVVLFAIGLALTGLEERVRRPAGVPARRVGAAAAILVLAGAAAVGWAAGPRVWDDLAGDEPESSTHFGAGTVSSRYDLWRVAFDEFRDRPVVGAGANNFAVAYLRERRLDEATRYPHSFPLQVLSQTGLVGALLTACALGAAVVAALRAAGRREAFERGAVVVAVVVFGYWLAHASVDWLWEMPAVTAPALAFLAAAAGAGASGVAPPRAGPGRRAALVAVAVLVAAGVVSQSLPWLAARERERAAATWRSDPAGAFGALDRARRLNPLSDQADLLSGAIASRLGDWDRMRRSFARALERNPSSWYAHFELGVVAGVRGRRAEALRHLARAERLDPLEPAIGIVRRRLLRGEPIEPLEIDRIFLDRSEQRGG